MLIDDDCMREALVDVATDLLLFNSGAYGLDSLHVEQLESCFIELLDYMKKRTGLL